MTALDQINNWPVDHAAAAALRTGVTETTTLSTTGDIDRRQRIASISKPMAAWAMLVAVEEGVISLDTPVGQKDCTLERLLSHAGGYSFDGPNPITLPGRTRIYSNTGFDLASAAVEEATNIPFADYIREALFEPLGMSTAELIGSAAYGIHCSTRDICAFVGEVNSPRLITQSTADDAVRVHYPSLAGMVPGVGRYTPCPWGLGFEIRGQKQPHWTGTRNSARTYGHFGGSGTMFWIDPESDIALVTIADRPFDEWALAAWPTLSDAVLEEFSAAAEVAS